MTDASERAGARPCSDADVRAEGYGGVARADLVAPSEARPPAAAFSRWAWLALCVAVAASCYSDISRYLHPTGEKYIPGYFYNGQADFTYPYLSARALLAGQNPYTTTLPEFRHPIFHPTVVAGIPYQQLYPPSHVLIYTPLVKLYGKNVVAAGHAFFHLSLGCVVLLGFAVGWFVQRARREALSPLFALLACVALLFHPGVQLGLDRGQSDILTACLCWSALLLALQRRTSLAWFLTVLATSIKAYPLLFAAGLVLTLSRLRWWVHAAVGVFAALVVFVLPVARFLPYGAKGALHRADMFWHVWYNHGFKHVVYVLVSPAAADTGRRVLLATALLVVALWGFRVWQWRRELHSGAGTAALVMLTTSSLLTVIGASALSVSYNLVLVLPGVLWLLSSQDRLLSVWRLNGAGRHVLGAALVLISAALFLCRFRDFPLAGVGLVGLLLVLAVTAVLMRSPKGLQAFSATTTA